MRPNLPDIPGYDVEAEIGRGGMGVVYKARQEKSGSVLALKMILCNRDATFPELARFRIEAEAMACLDHPNIVHIRDVGVYSGYPFIALEFAERGNLRQVAGGQPQPVRWSAELVRTLAMAMQHAHGRGMLHRDLKPANVLVMGDGTPKISDFGLVKFSAPISKVSASCCTISVSILDEELERFSRELEAPYRSARIAKAMSEEEQTRSLWHACSTRTGGLGGDDALQSVHTFLEEARRQARMTPGLDGLTCSGAIMGSPSYMAPEQARGDMEKIGPPTDVYALGGILYEMLTGQPPISGGDLLRVIGRILSESPRPPRLFDPTIPPRLEAICLKCLEKDTGRRYPKASALAADLKLFLDGDPTASAESWTTVGPPAFASESQVVPSTISPDDPAMRGSRTVSKGWWPFTRSRTGSARKSD
jgi:eukaryotic-like serine/threonine-protein kinase